MKNKPIELKYLEQNAIENTILILRTEYAKTNSGATLASIYFELKRHSNNQTFFAKLINFIHPECLNNLIYLSKRIGDEDFANKIKNLLEGIDLQN